MKINEYAYVNNKFYRLNDTLLAMGATIVAMLDVGWTPDQMIEAKHLIAEEPNIPEVDTINEFLNMTFRAFDNTKRDCCGDPSCSECHAPSGADTLTLKVDVSTVDEAISSVLECSQITGTLIRQVAERDAHGKAKYGTSLDRLDLTLTDWLQHQSEELMDGAGYALAAKREAEKLLRTRAAALEVCNAAQTASSLDELYKAIARLHDTL